MKRMPLAYLALMLLSGALAPMGIQAEAPDVYNVTWESPSKDSSGSMPLGNGEIGLNAWVEPSGDLLFYIARTDAWGDNGRLLKIGRVRVSLDPGPEIKSGFRQTLSFKDATLRARFGQGDRSTRLSLWVDANRPLVHVTIESARPVKATASIELWRTERHRLPSLEVSDVLLDRSDEDRQHAPTFVEPDTALSGFTNRVGWYHRNTKSVGPDLTMKIQGLEDLLEADPLLHRTFGGVITAAEEAERPDDRTLLSPSATSHRFDIAVVTRHPATEGEWLAAVDDVLARAERIPFEKRRKEHEAWWTAFWDRSWIRVSPSDPASNGSNSPDADASKTENRTTSSQSDAHVVTRGYVLQRFINACAGRGHFPIKFNGSIFTVDWPGKPGGPDYRRWGPGYWWQNTRLPYYTMPATGDFDLMEPLFRMYIERLLPVCRARTRRYFGHEGAYYPECIYFWGAVFSESYGWTPVDERNDPLQNSRWHKWEWVSGLELAWLALDYYAYTGDEAFLQEKALPLAKAVLRFFDEHYETGPDGKLVMHPSQALETWWDCTNPMPEVAGLHAVIERLLDLSDKLPTAEERAYWTKLRQKLPDLPTRSVDGTAMLAPAAEFANKRNIENPELYAVFPFRRYGVGRPDIDLAIEALRHRLDRGHSGWRQDGVFMAYLGLAEDARANLVARARENHADSRFPAFWGPNYDWVPDQDHGSILMKTLQAMLLQSDGKELFLLPAWPSDWDVDFKLHAPYKTTFQGKVRHGEVIELEVVPEERRQDLTIMD